MKVKCFGIAREIIGSNELEVEQQTTVADLRVWLKKNHPGLERAGRYMVAVNEEYASDDLGLEPEDVLAIIPPVSGG
jgi:molybdopterin converting factor subunit 1